MFSGGKDSVFALHTALLQGFEIAALITFKPSSTHPWYVHSPFVDYTWIQARLLHMEDRHIIIDINSSDRFREQAEIRRALKDITKKIDFDYIVLGIIASDAQRMLFADICEDLGVKLYTPFWGKDPYKHLLDIISSDIKFIITSINTWGLPRVFLGRVIDYELALKIVALSKKYGFNPSFEGGEAETFVIYTPLFGAYKICIEYDIEVVSEYEGYVNPKKVSICQLPQF
ncbi:MAG: diphthine--ammonia ligase [Ignisphaera sp.]